MSDDHRLIEDYLPIHAFSKEAAQGGELSRPRTPTNRFFTVRQLWRFRQ